MKDKKSRARLPGSISLLFIKRTYNFFICSYSIYYTIYFMFASFLIYRFINACYMPAGGIQKLHCPDCRNRIREACPLSVWLPQLEEHTAESS